MNRTTWLSAGRWWIGGVFAVVAAYCVLRLILAMLSERQGFGSPDGPGLEFLAVVAMSAALRGLLLIVLPAAVAYRLVAKVVSRALSSIEP